MTKYLFTLGLVSCAAIAQAQTRFAIGPVGAYTLSTGNFKSSDPFATFSTGYHSDFAVGVLAEVGFGHFALQPSVQFVRKGFSQHAGYALSVQAQDLSRDGYTRFNYLSFPVNLAYTQQASGQGFQVVAGAYLATLQGGDSNYFSGYNTTYASFGQTESGTVVAADSYPFRPTTYNYYMRQMDFGLQAGAGYHYQGLLVQASYSLGLHDLAAAPPSASLNARMYTQPDHYYNRGFQVSMAYLFGAKS